MDPTAVHEALDHGGLLNASHGPGCYALRLDVPDAVEAAHRSWLEHFDTLPGNDAVARLARAERVAYVGASSDVYDRIMDHARADVRKAAVMRAFPPVEVVEVWPASQPFIAERPKAQALAREGWVCWCNGEVIA